MVQVLIPPYNPNTLVKSGHLQCSINPITKSVQYYYVSNVSSSLQRLLSIWDDGCFCLLLLFVWYNMTSCDAGMMARPESITSKYTSKETRPWSFSSIPPMLPWPSLHIRARIKRAAKVFFLYFLYHVVFDSFPFSIGKINKERNICFCCSTTWKWPLKKKLLKWNFWNIVGFQGNYSSKQKGEEDAPSVECSSFIVSSLEAGNVLGWRSIFIL